MQGDIVRTLSGRLIAAGVFLGLLLAPALSSAAGSAEGDTTWLLCHASPEMAMSLGDVSRRVGEQVVSEDPMTVIHAIALGGGSAEFLLAATAEVVDRVRGRLLMDKVPLRKIRFHLSRDPAVRERSVPDGCRGVPVRLELRAY